ncbi:MAG: hypothetical protein AB7O73_07325 [Bacteroidia bacterium]
MKNLVKNIAAVVTTVVLMSTSMASNNPSDKTTFVINGRINNSGTSTEKTCKITLYNENTPVITVEKKWDRQFEFILQKNVWYTIKVEREGFMPLMISFNTEVHKSESIKDNSFYFETGMISTEEGRIYNRENLEFPVGHVVFNSLTGTLEAKDAYTDNYLTSIEIPQQNLDGVALNKANNVKSKDLSVDNTTQMKVADVAMYYVHKNDLVKGNC